MAIFDEAGVRVEKVDEIIQKMQGIARENFKDLLGQGEELDVGANSILGRNIGIQAEIASQNDEVIFLVWQNLDPNQAEGIFLDKAMYLWGNDRKLDTNGFAGLLLEGKIGVTVPARSMVSSQITGDIFETLSTVVFSSEYVNGITVQINNIVEDGEYAINYTTVYGMNTYPRISVKAVKGDTKEDLAVRFRETIRANSETLSAEVDNDDNVVVRFKNLNHVGNFTVSGDCRILTSFAPVSAISQNTKVGRQAENTLNIIQSPILGWLSATNPFDSIASQEKETDSEFKERARISRSIKSVSNKVSMYADLYALNGVMYVNIKDNIYENEAGDIAPHGVAVIVLGGDEQEIAEAIEANLPFGCITTGTIKKIVDDEYDTVEVSLSRPELVPIQISGSLDTDGTFPQNGRTLIREAIVRYFDTLKVGDSVQWSKIFNPINEIQGQSVSKLVIGVKGQELTQGNIQMMYNQIPVISAEDINL